MRMLALILAVATLPLTGVPTLAAPCTASDLPKKLAALPDFIVLEKNEEPSDALTRALGCAVPVPSLASGQLVDPKFMVGKNVVDTKAGKPPPASTLPT